MSVDEAGFYLLPMSVRTYAPWGQTPLLRVPLTRDHLSAISGLTPDGKLYMMVQDTAFDGPAIVRFLRHFSPYSGQTAAHLGWTARPSGTSG